jgi:hypothetical protein
MTRFIYHLYTQLITMSNYNRFTDLHFPNIIVTAAHIVFCVFSSQTHSQLAVRVCLGSHVIATQSVYRRAVCCLATAVVSLFISRSLPSNGSILFQTCYWKTWTFLCRSGHMEKWLFLSSPGLELWLLDRPARSRSLYWLCCPGSIIKVNIRAKYKAIFLITLCLLSGTVRGVAPCY